MDFINLLLTEENVSMQYEMVLMLLLTAIPAVKVKSEKKLALCWCGIFFAFAYLHRALLPFLAAGVYFFLLAGVISFITFLKPAAFIYPVKFFLNRASLFLKKGMRPFSAVIILVLLIQLCRMNTAIDYDSIRYGLRSDVLLSDGGIAGFFTGMGLVNTVYTYPKGFELITLPLSHHATFGMVLSFNMWVLAAVMLAAGEITSEVMRPSGENGGEGFDEALKPLTAKKPAGLTTGEMPLEPAFVLTAAAVSLIPGITNMAITAKPDLITLLTQLIFIRCIAKYFNTKAPSLTGIGIGALILGYAFKPTSLVFSSALGLFAIIFFAVKKIKLKINAAGIRFILLSAAFTGITIIRTFLITGLPFTSIFTGLFTKLGFTLKYPFREQSAISVSEGTLLNNIQAFISRLLHFFFCPSGEDMEHVVIAWGGLLFAVLLIAALLLTKTALSNLKELKIYLIITGGGETAGAGNKAGCGKTAGYGETATGAGEARTGKPEGAVKTSGGASPVAQGNTQAPPGGTEETSYLVYGASFLWGALMLIFALSLISLWFLTQVDGNYFGLLYALSASAGCTAVLTRLSYEQSPLGKGARKYLDGGSPLALIVLSAVMIYFTALTNWAGAKGFTPVVFPNSGYYNHEALYGIKNPLNWDKHIRVVAFAGEPECYKLKGRVESWVDIDGSGGNVYLTDTKLDIFKEYLSWADIDYIYADTQFLNDTTNERKVRAKTLFKYLIEDGVFDYVVLEAGSSNLLYCRIDKERASVSWEEPLSAEKAERTAAQLEYVGQVISFD